ncbi:MAG: tetratricopeptide repeat protein [Roseateles sp.]|uniref:tetratricopeptide repeat protein n=1 Tax=Roseateles sp. TaxID=1971397 RepID=UPI004034FD44
MSPAPNPYSQINTLSRQAFVHWGAGRLAEAAEGFASAITLLRDSGLPASADLHAQLAGVLDAQERLEEAVVQSELALAAEQAQGQGDGSAAVKIARHFLADPLLRQGQPQRALDVLTPSLVALPDDWLLNMGQAEALFADGRVADARTAAERALANASSQDKRTQLAERLAPVLSTR